MARKKPTEPVLTLEYLDPSTVKANSKNWRTHPRRQRQAFNALKEKVGWAGAPLLNKVTGNLIDGHMRVEEAIKKKENPIPFLVGSWTEEQENLLLQSLDPIGAMAGTNKEALDSLISSNQKMLEDLTNESNRKLSQLSQDLELIEDTAPLLPQSEIIRKPKQKKDLEQPPTEYHEENYTPAKKKEVFQQTIDEDIYFESVKNSTIQFPHQLPSLRSDMLATPDMAPTSVFARIKGEKLTPNTYYSIGTGPWPESKDGGVLGFFSDDYRFSHAYDFAARYLEELMEEDWTAILSPDFSLYQEHPTPIQLFNLYKSRWCSRYWQEAGFPIIPIIQPFNVPSETDLIVHSLPRPTPVLAAQARSMDKELYKPWCQLLNYATKTLKTEVLVIYGGLDIQKYIHGYFTGKCRVTYLPSFISLRSKKIKK